MPRPRSDSKDRILASARTLFRRHGYQGTGLAQVIEHSGAPRGSVYFLFPGGKEEMAVATVTEWARELRQFIRHHRRECATAREWISTMANHFAEELRASGFLEGLPLTTIALDSVPRSTALTVACRAAYDGWVAELGDGLRAHGTPATQARSLAELMLATLEGAVLLCRVAQSTEPIDRILPHILAAVENA
ncbi:TetR family transcriptional regulator [Longimycelium tulufanense]|uniref:TetR family transcriptional regulator n=1 Tax=Longimycelium tulufanense TaxID=907463 RepID=A0A8J3FWI5_9PSEU|nr:TetR/AcrR family transcriptional regulator [Longimycelium tulufanense]GGM60053.1 TetR family transcriptional regulator [Longimycelium tulufanense]